MLNIIIITVDPKRDTPEEMSEFLKNNGVQYKDLKSVR